MSCVPLNPHHPSGVLPFPPAAPTPISKVESGVTPQVPVTCAPPPPAPPVDPPENPDPPPPPRTVRSTDVTPAGGVHTCTFDEYENVTTTGDAANADELARQRTPHSHANKRTDTRQSTTRDHPHARQPHRRHPPALSLNGTRQRPERPATSTYPPKPPLTTTSIR